MSPDPASTDLGGPIPRPADRYSFDADIRLEPIAEHRFAAGITDRWNALGGGPNGGYLLAVCLEALRREMPLPDPLVASAFFTRRAVAGPAEVRTELARAGRQLATGEARLLQGGEELVRAVATFLDRDSAVGRELVVNRPPDLPPPEEALDLLGGGSIPGVTIADRVEYRVPEMPGWTQGRASGRPSAEFWMRFRDGREPDQRSLPLLVDAAAPVVLEAGEAGASTVELTVHVRGEPAPGWLACRVATRHVMDGYAEEDFEIWDSGGRLVAQSRQLALLPSPQDGRPDGSG